MAYTAHLLEIKNLTVAVTEEGQDKNLLEKVTFDVPQRSIVGLVGGSGSGKTTIGLSILRLLPEELRTKTGTIKFAEQKLFDLSKDEMRKIRGSQISMVFQEPLYAFNPVFRIGGQIEEVLEAHENQSAQQRRTRVEDLLNTVGVSDPKRIMNSYPHQLSGGLRQRAMIAQALAGNPKLIIADEPTSNLDVTIQAKIVALFKRIKNDLNVSILLITHDIGMVGVLADEIVVMNKGKVMEKGKTDAVLKDPQQKYTQELLSTL
jgi:ABC-type dipeptide/oligopeptide/nickel transport system ATPase component